MKQRIDIYATLRSRYGNVASLIMLAVIGMVFASLLIVLNYRFAGDRGEWLHTDFVMTWLGGRGLLEGYDLYEPASWEELHREYAGTYRDNPIYFYPLPAAILFLPFSLLPIPWAGTLWLLLNEIAFILGCTWLLRRAGFQQKPGRLLLFILIVATYQPLIIVIASGQYSLFMVNVLLAAYIFLEQEQDLLSGATLALLTLRPNTVVFFLPAVCLWALIGRRWKFIGGMASAGLLMLFVSEALQPGWAFTWLFYTVGSGGKLSVYGPISPTLMGMISDLGQGFPAGILSAVQWLTVILLGMTGLWICGRKDLHRMFQFVVWITISLCITPYAWNYDFVLLLFPLLYIFLSVRNHPRGDKKVLLLTIFTFAAFPYLLRYIAMQRVSDTLSGLIPFSGFLLLFYVHAANKVTHSVRARDENPLT